MVIRGTGPGRRCGGIAAVVMLVAALAAADPVCRAVAVPPYRVMYGYNDRARESWRETLNVVNIITGTTTDGAFVQELRQRGILFAYHVLSRAEGARTAEATVREWERPFRNELGGSLPGGFDAIAIDEIGSPDGTPDSRRVCDALKLLRLRYPDRRILVWGGWRMGEPGILTGFHRNQLRAVVAFTDLLLCEMYLKERHPSFGRFTASADFLYRFNPQLLGKTVYALSISQTRPFAADDDERIDFQGLIEQQVALMHHDELLKRCAGIGFWAFYRARPDTLHFVNQLLERYYLGGSNVETGHAVDSPIRNGGFEEGVTGWSTNTGRAVVPRSYVLSASPPRNHGGVSHRCSYLAMRRGESANRIRQRVQLQPSAWYVFSALVFGDGTGRGLVALDDGGRELDHLPGASDRWKPWQQLLLTFLTDATGSTILELNDAGVARGTDSAWDFVEIGRCLGSNRPPAVEALCRLDGKLVLCGRNFLPGGTVFLGSHEVSSPRWLDSGHIDLGDSADWPSGSYATFYRKPQTSLHPHEAGGLLTVVSSDGP